jgi:hypothetical protein
VALFRWLRRLARRIFWPYHCRECGKPYRRARMEDFAPHVRQELRRTGEWADVLAHTYKCDHCHGPDRAAAVW